MEARALFLFMSEKTKQPKIFIIFKTPEVDPERGIIILPNIDTIRFDGVSDEKVPEDLAQGVKIKQMFLGEIENGYAYIDKDGLRFDKK